MANFTEIGLIASIKGLTTFNSGVSQMRRQMGLTGRSASSFSKGFNTSMGGVGQSILNAGRTVRSFGNELVFLGFQLTFLATGAFAAVTKAGSEFESTLVRMSTLANESVGSISNLGVAAQQLSTQVGIGPTEIADAMFDIVSSGFDAAEAMEIIQSTSRGAAVGLGDVRAVTDAVTSAMRAFADQGLTAARATDILIQAVREGKGEVDKLAPTIGRVLGIAAQLGLTFEETTAFIATFTRVGVPVEVAVTSLRSALTNILKPTAAAETALGKYGATMDDIRQIIEEKGLHAALITLATIMGDDSESMGRVIGSARALAGVLINTGPLAADYAQVLSAIGDSAGVTADAFDLFAQTTEFKLNVAKAAFESLFITVSNTLRPIVNLVLDQIPRMTLAIEALVKQRPGLFLLAGGFAAIIAVAGPLLIVVGLTITSLGTLISVVGAFTVALASILSPLGLVIAGLVAFGVTFVGLFVASFQKTRDKLAEQGRAISFDAYAWGRNIIVQFARGMAAAAVYVIQVLTAIGHAIRTLLESHSPPKLLPDLDKWGKAAMEAYMDGWLQADFNVFQQIAGTIEQFLRSIGLDQINVVPAILQIRTEIAKILDIFRDTGQVATEAINNITAAFGDAGDVVGQYIMAMLEVEAATQAVTAAQEELREAQAALTQAQEQLNAVQEKYNALLEPISDELEAIARRRQEVVDDMRIAELQAIVNDASAPALAKELALMELREIELRRQQQAIEDMQEADEEAAQSNIDNAQDTVDAAQEGLDLAQEELRLAEERVQALHQFIQVQQENNALIQEQINLLKGLQDSLGGAGGAAEELGGALGDALSGIEPPDIGGILDGIIPDQERIDMLLRKLSGPGGPDDIGLGSLDDLFGDITRAAENLVTEMEGIGEDIAEEFQPAIDAFDELTTVWAGVFATLITGVPPDSAIGRVAAFIEELTADQVRKVGDLATEFERLFGNLQGIASGPIGELVGDIASLLVSIITLGGVLTGLTEEGGPLSFLGESGPFSDFVLNIDNLGEAILELLIPVQKLTVLLDLVNDTLELVLPGVESFIRRARLTWEEFVTFAETAAPRIEEAAGNMATAIENLVGEAARQIGDFIGDIVRNIFGGADKGEKRFGRMGKRISGEDGIISKMVSAIVGDGGLIPSLFDALVGPDGLFPGIGAKGEEAFEALSTAIKSIISGESGIVPSVQAAFGALYTWIGEQVEAFREAGRNIGQGLLEGIQEMVQPLIDFMEDLIARMSGTVQEENESDSPSKVYMRHGQDMIDGLILGMTQRAAMAMAVMGEIMDSTQGQATRAMAQPVAGPSVAPSVYNSTSRESNFGPINIHSGLDLAMLRALIRQEVNGSL